MSYRDDTDALSHQCTALEQEAAAAEKRLSDAKRLLEEARRRDRLPVLDNIHIAAPCKADWDEMRGDERTRFCGSCEKNVYNLSSMKRAEAQALLIEKEGKLCVRYYQRQDGTILTADCPEGVVRRRRRIRIVAAAFGAMSAVTAVGALFVGRGAGRGVMMGAIAQAKAPVPFTPTGSLPKTGEVVQLTGEPMPMMGSVVALPPEREVKGHLMGKPSMPREMKGKISVAR